MAKGTVKDIDRGARALIARMAEHPKTLRVGVYGDAAGQRAHDGAGATVGDIASAHEFTIPSGEGRRWLRGTLDEKAPEIVEGLRRVAAAVVRGDVQPEQALRLLGQKLKGEIQKGIAAGRPPALSAAYLPRKLAKYPGATTPLIASGQFRGSIDYQIEGSGK